MYLIKRSNSIYYVEYKDENTNQKKRISTRTKNKSVAEIFLESIRRQISLKEIKTVNQQSRPETNVNYFLKEYSNNIKACKSQKYWKSVNHACNNFNIQFGNKYLSELKYQEIENYFSSLFNKSKYSAYSQFRNLRAAFNKAVDYELIKTNPLSKFRFPKIPKGIPVFITFDELEQILKNVRSTIYGEVYKFAFYTGMRRGEILNLKWSNVDFTSRLIYLKNTTDFFLKNKKERILPMHERIFELLNLIKDRKLNSEYVFIKNNGIKLTADVVTENFRYAVKKTSLSPKIHFHTLRHSFASNLVRHGVSLLIVKELLGHEDVATTMIYSHLRRDDLFDAVKRI